MPERGMTVAELREFLRGLPQDYELWIELDKKWEAFQKNIMSMDSFKGMIVVSPDNEIEDKNLCAHAPDCQFFESK